MNIEMRLRSHTARKHFPALPDDIWTIILDFMTCMASSFTFMWLQRCRLVRTAKCFALTSDSRLPFQREKYSPDDWCLGLRWMGNGGSCCHKDPMSTGVITSFVPRTTAISYFHEFSNLRTLDMLHCILSNSDQLTLHMVPWPNLRYCRMNDCGLKDRPIALFLKKWMASINMTPIVTRFAYNGSPTPPSKDLGDIKFKLYVSLQDNRLLGPATIYQLGLMMSCWMHLDLCLQNTIIAPEAIVSIMSYLERALEHRWWNMLSTFQLNSTTELPSFSLSCNTTFKVCREMFDTNPIPKRKLLIRNEKTQYIFGLGSLYNPIEHLVDLPDPIDNVSVRLTMNQNARRGTRDRVSVNWSL